MYLNHPGNVTFCSRNIYCEKNKKALVQFTQPSAAANTGESNTSPKNRYIVINRSLLAAVYTVAGRRVYLVFWSINLTALIPRPSKQFVPFLPPPPRAMCWLVKFSMCLAIKPLTEMYFVCNRLSRVFPGSTLASLHQGEEYMIKITALFTKRSLKSCTNSARKHLILHCCAHASGKYFRHFIKLEQLQQLSAVALSWPSRAYITLLPITVRFYSNTIKFWIDRGVAVINKR